MTLNKPLRLAIYFAIVAPIVLAFLPFLLVWTALDIARKMIMEFALWLQRKLKVKEYEREATPR